MFNPIISNRLSWFRTEHRFLNYTEIANHDDYQNVISDQGAANQLVMLGNGSNCLFARKTIKSFVVKNKLPKETIWKSKNHKAIILVTHKLMDHIMPVQQPINFMNVK